MRKVVLCLFYALCAFAIAFSLFWMALPRLALPSPAPGADSAAETPVPSEPSLAAQPLPVTDGNDRYTAAVAAPILCEGDVLGLVLFLSADGRLPGEGEYKLAQTVSAFLGKHMES